MSLTCGASSDDGAANDGLWEGRFLVSSDGAVAGYPPTRDARRPFVGLGNNRCKFLGSVDDVGGWCSPWDDDYSHTSWDTSMVSRTSLVTPNFRLDGQDQALVCRWGCSPA